MRQRSILPVAMAMFMILLPGLPSAAAEGAAPSSAALTAAVEEAIGAQAASQGITAAGARKTRVSVTRQAGGTWAFGTAVLPGAGKEEYPHGWLFLARKNSARWEVGLDGTVKFSDLAAASTVLSTQERQAFSARPGALYAGGDYRTGMRLPFGIGQSWRMTGGPHGWSGAAAPWSSIDLAGGDGRVLAARGGLAYTMCRGWIRVIHDRGYSTDYYHLFNSISANGLSVGEGAFLGNIGTDVTCGGSASGAHVHLGLRQNSAYVPIAGHGIGKWALENGAAAYQGSALHGSARVYAGGSLYNYGVLGFTQGVIDANGGGAVNRRTGPGTGYAIAGSVGDGATVSIACSAYGTTHSGRYGSTNLWDQLTDGTWISDAFVWTGVNGTVNGFC